MRYTILLLCFFFAACGDDFASPRVKEIRELKKRIEELERSLAMRDSLLDYSRKLNLEYIDIIQNKLK